MAREAGRLAFAPAKNPAPCGLPTVAGNPGCAQGAHDLVQFRDEDAVACDRLQVVGDGPIRCHAALENDRSAVVEKEVADARDDRPGLARQAAAITSASG